MRVFASQQFSANHELSKIYTVSIQVERDGIINTTFTIDESVIGLFQEKMQALNLEIKINNTQTPMQDGHLSATCSLRTDSDTLISTMNELKKTSLIDIEFADKICHELPNLIQHAQLSQLALDLLLAIEDSRVSKPVSSSLPTLDAVHQVKSDKKAVTQEEIHMDLDNGTADIDREWSTKIDVLTDALSLIRLELYGSAWVRLCILIESEARAIIKRYCDGSFLVFRKNETYHLLAKVNSEIRQFDILTKSHKLSFKASAWGYVKPSFFNLKNEKGDLVFGANGVSASSLHEFLNTSDILKQFPFQLRLNDVKILDQPNVLASLKQLVLRRLLIQDSNLSWLPSLQDALQEMALFYFLNTFISNLPVVDIQFSSHNLLYNQPDWRPARQKYYSAEEIRNNLGYLRTLYHKGSTKAAMVLASLVYSGVFDYVDRDSMGFLLFPRSKPQQKVSCNLEEYREITQNPVHFPKKIDRDIFLLRYFEAKNDREMITAQLKQIDLSQAILLDIRFCSNEIILSCIKQGESSFQQLISNKHIFHHLIVGGRLHVADEIKHKLPEEVFRVKDATGRNTLHILVDYILDYAISSESVIGIVNFICQQFPEMLAETDNEGCTVSKRIEQFKPRDQDKWSLIARDKLKSTIATYSAGTIKMSLGSS